MRFLPSPLPSLFARLLAGGNWQETAQYNSHHCKNYSARHKLLLAPAVHLRSTLLSLLLWQQSLKNGGKPGKKGPTGKLGPQGYVGRPGVQVSGLSVTLISPLPSLPQTDGKSLQAMSRT
jgi:hypothetical protein